MYYMIRGKKLVTVSELGTIKDGAMLIENGVIKKVDTWENLIKHLPEVEVIDCSNYVITPSLIDCHTHLLEFAPTSLYPVTLETHFLASKGILFQALASGITALGEQICGHPLCDFSIEDYRKEVKDFPIDISFAATSISIGFEDIAHFTSITQSQNVKQTDLSNTKIVKKMAESSDYPGENIFINATPANFTKEMVPRAGEMIYDLNELKKMTSIFHESGKSIGCHVAGEEGIELALNAGFDVLHHAHGITDSQIDKVAEAGVQIVATPIGGTHLEPNSPEDIIRLVNKKIPVSISTDGYLPPYPNVPWLPFKDSSLKGPEVLMQIAHSAMKQMKEQYDENQVLALLTANPAKLLGKEAEFGSLKPGLKANFLVAEGIPGLEITQVTGIKNVYYQGVKVIERK
ncbi:amidohydrolase family protein [Bacillus sp. B15-48]|uniref:amidohydrolase family protein n=1 Tax=Bacillus sp. B15-48 TaxID=1548601 RepID=UPI00193F1BD4|nr:amidohydrolase family protein [Bacillus sp. B15-48]MBM4763211.1 amidohydrolase family protein [Bacillus sp. B15-48]